MKKLLGGFALSVFLAAPVMAADLPARMPVKAAPVPVAALYSWTGCYIGIHGGWAWGQKRIRDAAGVEITAFNHDVDGGLVGGQIGCNVWQNDRWVLGIEGQAAWANIDGEAIRPTIGSAQTAVIPGGFPQTFRTKADIIGSIAARLGYAFGATGQTLVFVKGGAAFIHEGFTVTTPVSVFEADKELRWGWMVGAGFEQALGGSNWSFKAEYNYNNFGKDTRDFCTIGGVCNSLEIKQHIHLVKVGINYRFGGWGSPVVARY